MFIGYEFTIKHLDGKKINIKTNTNDIIKQSSSDYNKKYNYIKYKNKSVTLNFVATANISDYNMVVNAIENGYLKKKNITAFYIKNNTTYFYKNISDKYIKKYIVDTNNSNLYIRKLNNISLHCIENLGIVNNDIYGDLYLIFNIVFPNSISDNLKKQLLESELNKSKSKISDNNLPTKNTIIKNPYDDDLFTSSDDDT